MAVGGRKPKDDRSQVRHRVAPTHEWAEVDDVPYDGDRPKLAQRYMRDPETGRMMRLSWPAATNRWWDIITAMPHCGLWTDSDWQVAVDTAEVHARWAEGRTAATELRIREKLLGTTMDSRRDLRIKYVTPKSDAPAPESGPAEVVDLDAYRDLYG